MSGLPKALVVGSVYVSLIDGFPAWTLVFAVVRQFAANEVDGWEVGLTVLDEWTRGDGKDLERFDAFVDFEDLVDFDGDEDFDDVEDFDDAEDFSCFAVVGLGD